MISIIICSKYPEISRELKENIDETIGVTHEIIVIDNSSSQYSIFSAYNKGVSHSKHQYLCFIHEDVIFKTQNWGKNLIEHLKDKNTGVIGVAGGKLATRIPASWWTVGPGFKNLVQHYKKKSTIATETVNDQTNIKQQVVVLDGVFLSLRKELFDTIRFDEELTGFHAYDHDISIQTIIAGYKNYVVFNILLEHFSEGNLNAHYYTNLIKLYKKRIDYLPIFTPDISVNIRENIPHVERKMLEKLIRSMARSGSTTKNIVSETRFFVNNLKSKGVSVEIKNLHLKIFFTRLFNAPKHLLK